MSQEGGWINKLFRGHSSPTTATTAAPPLRIQVASDLHLEFYTATNPIPDDIIVPSAPVLALLGDIGLAGSDTLRAFLHLQAERFEHVILVAGNHEYYNSRDIFKSNKPMTMVEQQTWLAKVCQERPNLCLLERKVLEINGVLILGTTLWSFIPSPLEARAQARMNDYQMSFVAEGKRLRVQHTNAEFHKSAQWLEQQIDQAEQEDKPVVVLTHHAPHLQGTVHPHYANNEMVLCCVASDLRHLLEQPNVKAWACGLSLQL